MPDVLSDLDPGSILDIIETVSSLLPGVHLRMHHPSAHWMTLGAESPQNALSLPARLSLVREGSTVNATYLRLPLLDLTTIVTPSLVRYKRFLYRGDPAREHHPASVAYLVVHGQPFAASAYESAVCIGQDRTAGAYVPVHHIAASGTCDVACRAGRQEVPERGAAVGAFPRGFRAAQMEHLAASALGNLLLADVVEAYVAPHVGMVIRRGVGGLLGVEFAFLLHRSAVHSEDGQCGRRCRYDQGGNDDDADQIIHAYESVRGIINQRSEIGVFGPLIISAKYEINL